MDHLAHVRVRPQGRGSFLTLVVAMATVVAVLALASARPVFADHTINLGASGTDQSRLCTGDYFKIEDAGVLEAGTHAYTGTTRDGATFTAVLTVVLDGDDEVDSIVVVSLVPSTALIVFKAGRVFGSTDGAVISPASGKAISNVAFCLEVETPTPTST